MEINNILPFVAWPLAALASAVAFMFMFKTQIAGLIDRTRSISKSGIRTYEEVQLSSKKPNALTEFLETYHNPLLREVESACENEIRDRGLVDPHDVQKALCKGLATQFILRWFETAQHHIFASQIAALKFLNAQPQKTARSDLKSVFFDNAVVEFPEVHAGRSFDQWFAFLRQHGFVVEEGSEVQISVAGREFLQWRVQQGHSGPPYG